MYAKNCTASDLANAAIKAGLDIRVENERDRIKFTLRLRDGETRFMHRKPSPTDVYWSSLTSPQATGWKFRKSRSVCFHGHYRFLYELFFHENGWAIIESNWYGKIVYNIANFQEKAAELGMTPLGSEGNIYHVWQVREQCSCAEEGELLGPNNSPY